MEEGCEEGRDKKEIMRGRREEEGKGGIRRGHGVLEGGRLY